MASFYEFWEIGLGKKEYFLNEKLFKDFKLLREALYVSHKNKTFGTQISLVF